MAAFTRSNMDHAAPCEPVNGSSILEQHSSSRLRRCKRNGRISEENHAQGSTTRTPSFTKVISGKTSHHSAYCCRLSLPKKFCEEHSIQKHVTMTDATGDRLWHMRFQVRSAATTYTISNGWREFSYDHSLKMGDELVFTLLSPSHFGVAFANGLAMHPTQDGDEYPWKLNYSRLACLSWQRVNIRHSKARQEGENNIVVTSPNVEEIVLQSEQSILRPEKATPFMESIPNLQGQPSEEQKHSKPNKQLFCQCETGIIGGSLNQRRSLEFTHLECTNPDGTTYLQIFDSDSD